MGASTDTGLAGLLSPLAGAETLAPVVALGADRAASLAAGLAAGLGVALAEDFGTDFAAVLAGAGAAGFLTEALGMAILLLAPAGRRISLRRGQGEWPDNASFFHQLSTGWKQKSRNL
eukprot:gene48-56_t